MAGEDSWDRLLDAVALRRSFDPAQLDTLARSLRGYVPADRLSIQRRGVPVLTARIVGVRVAVSDRVYRAEVRVGRVVCEVGEAVNGVASRHDEVPVERWARELRKDLGSFGRR